MRIFHTLRTCKWRQTQTWGNIGNCQTTSHPTLSPVGNKKSFEVIEDFTKSGLVRKSAACTSEPKLGEGATKTSRNRMPQQRESLSETQLVKNECPSSKWSISIYIHPLWLVVSTHLKSISQNGNLPQIGVKIKHIWNILKAPPRIYIPSPSFSSKLQTLKKSDGKRQQKTPGTPAAQIILVFKIKVAWPSNLPKPKACFHQWKVSAPCLLAQGFTLRLTCNGGRKLCHGGGKVASFEFRRTRCPRWGVSQKIDGASSLTSTIAFEHDSLLNYFPGVTDFEIIRTFCMKRTTHVFFCWIVQTWLRRRRFSPKFGLQRRKGQIKWISTAPWNEQHMISDIYIYIL